MDKVKEFWNKRAELGESSGTNDIMAKELELRILLENIHDASVLDIGVKMSEIKFGIRFYEREKADVEAFLKSAMAGHPEIKRYAIEPLTKSMNNIVGTENDWQAWFYFDSEEDMKAIYDDAALFAEYQKVSVPAHLQKSVTYHKRQPGDVAFMVR